MSDADTVEEPAVDYFAPFESVRVGRMRRGILYRGPVRSEYAGDRAELERILRHAPGEYSIEKLDGRVYATLRVYSGRRPPQRLCLSGDIILISFTCARAQ